MPRTAKLSLELHPKYLLLVKKTTSIGKIIQGAVDFVEEGLIICFSLFYLIG